MINIDDEDEYRDMAKTILSQKSKNVFISVELDDIKKGCKKAHV